MKVFLGVFSAISACFALFLVAWGVALLVDGGWRTAVGVVLGMAAVVTVVTAAIVFGVWRFAVPREPSVPLVHDAPGH